MSNIKTIHCYESAEYIKNELDVVMVRFPKDNGEYDFRLCEI